MFGIFGITKDANKAHDFLHNFTSFAIDTIGMFGFKKGAELVSSSQWVAGPQLENERGFTYINFRISVPFETFYGTLDNELKTMGEPTSRDGKLSIWGDDNFRGFRLVAHSNKDLVQVAANNPPHDKATARACMLMARFESKGATDISDFLAGRF